MWRSFSNKAISSIGLLKNTGGGIAAQKLHPSFRTVSISAVSSAMKYLSQSEATKIDQELFNDYGFSVDQLMELAGLSCAKAIFHLYGGDKLKGKKVLVVVGPGNNGGDGLVCARHLQLFGLQPEILYPKESKNEIMKRLVQQTKLMDIDYLDSVESLDSVKLSSYTVVVDAIFGFSFRPPIRQPYDQILRLLNEKNGPPICSIDIPSGWDVEEGPQAMPTNQAENKAVAPIHPDVLISLTAPKACARHFQGRAHVLGGRFVPNCLAEKYALNLPSYPSSDLFIQV